MAKVCQSAATVASATPGRLFKCRAPRLNALGTCQLEELGKGRDSELEGERESGKPHGNKIEPSFELNLNPLLFQQLFVGVQFIFILLI